MSKKNRDYDEEEDLEDDDDDEDFNEEDEEEEDDGRSRAAAKKSKRSRAAQFFDEAAEEDDEEEEEEEKASKRKKRSVFIDDIADVDDDDEEEEPDEEAEDLIDDRDVGLPDTAAPSHYRDHIGREREEKTEEEMAKYIEDRYKQYDDRGEHDDGAADAGTVGQQGLLPTINDPKLWMVTCRPGREREACVQMLQKYYTLHERQTPLLIKSAIALDHLKGFIYVEAEKEAHVRDAIRGLRTCFSSKGVRLVPLSEMVDAITVNKKAKLNIVRDNWVRVRTGLYKDDLAKVTDVDFAAQRVTVRLLHRLDLHAMATRDENEKRQPFGRQPVVRPPSKPFNADEARQLALLVTRVPGPDGQTYLQLGSHRFINGYLERVVAMKNVMVLDAMPPLDELAKYNSAGQQDIDDSGDLASLMQALPADGSSMPKAKFSKGDKVVFLRGELQNLEATVTDVRDDGKIMVVPKIEGFNEAVDCDPDELRKSFMVGDHVRVVNGQRAGESGMLLHILSNDLCVILSDTSREELKVFSRDLTQHAESDTGVESLGPYQLHDLVQLDQTTAGVIIKIEKMSARVVTSEGSLEKPDIRVCKVTDMVRKVLGRNIITTDKVGNKVSVNDYVTITEGPPSFKGKGGVVEYVWRAALFIKGRELADVSGGYVCVRARSCMVRGGTNTAADLARMAAGTPRSTPQSPAHGGSFGARPGYAPQSPISSGIKGADLRPPPPRMGGGSQGSQGDGFGGGGGGGGGRGHRSGGPGALVGKMVRVVGGNYNGYRGRVKQETDTHVQIELDAINKVSTVKKEQVRVEGGMAAPAARGFGGAPGGGLGRNPAMPQPRSGFGLGAAFGPSQGGSYGSQAGQSQGYGTRTPMHPSQTPMHHLGTGAATPLHHSMTPGYAPYTPLHHANTPMDDNYMMLGGGSQDAGARGGPSDHNDRGVDRSHGQAPLMSAATPGLHGYTPSAYTPAMTPSGYGGDPALTPGMTDMGGMMQGAGLPGDMAHAPTPGLAPTPGQVPTPYMPASTPAITPALDSAPTPGGGGYGYTPATGLTPGMAATPGLPAVTPALTPGVGGFPGTPGMDLPSTPHPGTSDSYVHWEGVLVTLHGRDGQTAVVRSLAPDGRCLMVQRGVVEPAAGAWVPEPGSSEEAVEAAALALVQPLKKDRVKILGESDSHTAPPGAVGTLIGIDSSDGIVKVDNTTDLVIIDMTRLGKLVG